MDFEFSPEDEIPMPEMAVESKFDFKLEFHNPPVKCFICQQPTASSGSSFVVVAGQSDVGTFDSFCRLFDLPPFEEKLRNSSVDIRPVENSKFCEICSIQILDAMNMYNEVKNLEQRIAEIKNGLRHTLITSAPPLPSSSAATADSAASSSTNIHQSDEILRKCVVQSLSKCEVVLDPLPEDMIPKKRPRRERKPVFKSDDFEVGDFEVESDTGWGEIDDETYVQDEADKKDIEDEETRDDWFPRVEAVYGKRPKGRRRPRPKRILREKREYPCKYCEKVYATRKNLEGHISEVHGESLAPACTYCEMEFIEEYVLDGEGKKLAEKPWKCRMDGCSLSYKTLGELRKHHMKKCMASPTVKKKPSTYPCSKCDKIYTTDVALRNHLRGVHDQTFKCHCDTCGKGFQAKSTMQRHISLAHSKDKPFKCDQCPLSFKQKVQLVHHSRRHTGELPFVCYICGKAFHAKQRVRQHMQNVHGDGQVPCPMCGKTFKSKDYVSKHIYDTHEKKRKNRGHTKRQAEPGLVIDGCDEILQEYFTEGVTIIPVTELSMETAETVEVHHETEIGADFGDHQQTEIEASVEDHQQTELSMSVEGHQQTEPPVSVEDHQPTEFSITLGDHQQTEFSVTVEHHQETQMSVMEESAPPDANAP